MTQQRRDPGADLIGEFQRRLVRLGARGMSRGLGDQIRGTLGRRGTDVWEHATAPEADEGPECPWCPHCRARRMLRESGPGLATHAAAAGGVVASAISDAVSVFEAVLASSGSRPPEHGGPGGGAEVPDVPDVTAGQDGTHEHAHDGPAEGFPHEPDDRG